MKNLLSLMIGIVLVSGFTVANAANNASINGIKNGSITQYDNDTYNQPTANGGVATSNNSNNSGLYGSGNSKVKNVVSNGSNSVSNSNSNSGVYRSGNSRNFVTSDSDQKQSQINEGNTVSTSNVNDGNNSSVNVVGDTYTHIEKRAPVNTAYAPMLTSGIDTCMGSVSVGGQAPSFGLSFGKTILDKDCVIRKDARVLHNMGYRHAAIHLLCQKPEILRAMGDAGEKECENMRVVEKKEVITYTNSRRNKCEYPSDFRCRRN